jgi:hypothetical protein
MTGSAEKVFGERRAGRTGIPGGGDGNCGEIEVKGISKGDQCESFFHGAEDF